MKLIQRIGYYLGGFAIGLVILTFFLSGKKTSCSYGPDARVLKNINSKAIIFQKDVLSFMTQNALDSAEVKTMLKKGDIDFSESKPRKQPCGLYLVEAESKKENLFYFTVENCDSTATITNIKLMPSSD